MGLDSSIRRRIKTAATEERDKLKEQEIFTSPEMTSYLEGLAVSMTDDADDKIDVLLYDGGPKGMVACTNGEHVQINTSSEIVSYFPTTEQRFVAITGLFFHELGHTKFLDFNEAIKALNIIGSGHFYGEAPTGLSSKEEAAWLDMETSIKDENARAIFQSVFKELSNIVSDTHDEDAMIDEFGSFVGEGIYLCRNALHASCPLFEDMKNEALKNGGSDLTVAYNLLLQMTRFGDVLCRDTDTLDNSVFGEMLARIKPHANVACATDDSVRQFSELNYIMLALWPFIRAEIQKMSKGSGGNSSSQSGSNGSSAGKSNQSGSGGKNGNDQQGENGNSSKNKNGSQGKPGGAGDNNAPASNQITKEQVQEILNQLKQGAEKAGQTQSPEGKTSSQEAIDRRRAERNGEKKDVKSKENGESQKSSSDAIYAALKDIADQIAQAKAEKKLENEAAKQLEADVKAVFAKDSNSPHKFVELSLDRKLSVSAGDKNRYEEYMRPLIPVSKRLQRHMEDALRDMRDGYVARHRLNGKMLMVNDAYRPDGRCFASKKLPQDFPDMAISVLIDHSGSMSGDRIKTAMKAAMLLYDFATSIGIPISVAGHHSPDGKGVKYIEYADFDQISKNDRYRLAKMTASGNNRDGMALNICANLLGKRQEDVKLLIIISDGRPNHTNYGGDAAAKDIQQIVRKSKRNGIEIIAAGIGNDRKQIQDIYQDAYLDISDLSKLPKIMTDIVKKRVLRNAI